MFIGNKPLTAVTSRYIMAIITVIVQVFISTFKNKRVIPTNLSSFVQSLSKASVLQ